MMPSYQLPKSLMRYVGLAWIVPVALCSAIAGPNQLQSAYSQTSGGNRPLQIKSDIQEFNSKTQVITARGNVQMVYSARGIQATAAQAQYFSNERQIVLSGNVYILQNGANSIRGEKVVYLIDEGRFVAMPLQGRQVESIYIINDSPNGNPSAAPAPSTAPLRRSK